MWILTGVGSFFMARRADGLNRKPIFFFVTLIMVIFSCLFSTIKARQLRSLNQSTRCYSVTDCRPGLFIKRLFAWEFWQTCLWPSAQLTNCMKSIMPILINSKHFFKFPCFAFPAPFQTLRKFIKIFFIRNANFLSRYFLNAYNTSHNFF